MTRALLISGWAHGVRAIEPMGRALEPHFDVILRSGAGLLDAPALPEAEVIITGSMGGLLAMERLPSTCRKLVLISSSARFCAAPGYPCGTHGKVLRRMMKQLAADPAAVLEAFYRNVHHPDPVVATDPECGADTLLAGLQYLLDTDVREQAASIPIPVLLLHGGRDRIIPVAAAEALAQLLPDSRLKVFAEDGHALPAHRFGEVMAELLAFLLPAT